MNLLQRFKSFIATMPGFESIDALLDGVHLEDKKRADYLFSDRKVIVEQKALIADPSDRPQRFVNQLMRDGRVLAYGRTSTRAIFGRMADGALLQRKMFLGMTKGLEDDHVAKADKQTRDTREIFGIADAIGVLVILNESAPTLHPDLVRYGLQHVFQKKAPDGSFRYRHNDGVVVISEAHTMTGSGRGMPCFSALAPQCRNAALVSAFSDSLVAGWASFNGLPVRRCSPAESASNVTTHATSSTRQRQT